MTTPADAGAGPWLLLIHQIPPKPDYLRVKVGRRLQRLGAVPVKNSVYVLPDGDRFVEDFQWVRAEIIAGKGDASICRADFVDGLSSDQICDLFRAAREADYAAVTTDARELRASLRGRDRKAASLPTARLRDEVSRLRKRLAAIEAIDYFGAPSRATAREAIDAVAALIEPHRPAPGDTSPVKDRSAYRGRVWVTRSGIFVDRMASGWLIRRFIDSDARFRFVAEGNATLVPGEIGFDMFDAEFTHVGDHCTFETLLDRFALTEGPLRALAEVVHDIDLKDEKFERADAPGIERVLRGIVAAHPDDDARLERACTLFDELHAVFAAEAEATTDR